jgi:hypothetical protein
MIDARLTSSESVKSAFQPTESLTQPIHCYRPQENFFGIFYIIQGVGWVEARNPTFSLPFRWVSCLNPTYVIN